MTRDGKIRSAARFNCPIKCVTAEELKYVFNSLHELRYRWAGDGAPLDENVNPGAWLIKSLNEGCGPVYITPKNNNLVCYGTSPDHPNGAFISVAAEEQPNPEGDISMDYTATVKMPLERFQHVNELLNIDSIPELPIDTITSLNVETHAQELLFSASFQNGVVMDLYLYSGMENYYTGPEFRMPDGNIVSSDECVGFSLDDKEVFSLGENTYTVIVEAAACYEDWIILAEDGGGKVHLYRRVTEDSNQFVSDVRLLPGMTVLVVYREKDVVENKPI